MNIHEFADELMKMNMRKPSGALMSHRRNANPHGDVPIPEHQSIFADTHEGVPSPTIPHLHPYPTRYHGPMYTTPRFMLPYQEQAWNEPMLHPQTPGCLTCKKPASGLGDFRSPSGSPGGDAVIGLGLGLLMSYAAKDKKDAIYWAVGGAAAGYVAGTVGLLGIAGLAFYKRLT